MSWSLPVQGEREMMCNHCHVEYIQLVTFQLIDAYTECMLEYREVKVEDHP